MQSYIVTRATPEELTQVELVERDGDLSLFVTLISRATGEIEGRKIEGKAAVIGVLKQESLFEVGQKIRQIF